MTRQDRYDAFMKEYNSLHKCCPKCGSEPHMTTLVGYLLDLDHTEDYKDLNRCTCTKCGDSHTMHERISISDVRNNKLDRII